MAKMPRCKTCRYWGDLYQGACSVVDVIQEGPESISVDVTVDDNSGLDVLVMTSAEFGCVLHRPKRG